MEQFSLSRKIAIVTGASGKLGKIWTKALADAGSAVVATDITECPGDDIAKLMEVYNVSHNKIAYCGSVDITKREDAERLNDFCKKTFGIAGILVNNAGIDQPPSASGAHYTIEGYPGELFRKILDVNTFGAFNMTQVFGDEMRKNGSGGSVINIGSLYASVSPDEKLYTHLANDSGAFIKPPSYGMSKAAIVNMTKYLAAHWGKFGIRVNTLSPGGVEGGQDPEFKRKFCDRVPLGRMATADDLTGTLVFLASDASKYVTGTELIVDGGFTAL